MLFPLIQDLLLLLGLMSSVLLFLSLKREIRMIALRNRKQLEEVAEQVKHTLEIIPPAPEPRPVTPVPVLRSGFNLNKRVHVMRMLRRGEDVNHIAAALSVPRREIELLVRVQQLSAAR